jgi:hypothetical protein
MVKLYTIKQKQIAFLSLLLTALPSFCADDAAEQEAPKKITFSCNIPGLNAPLQLERTDGSLDKIALAYVGIDHGRLLCKQLKSQQSVQEMVIDHALLAVFRIAAGFTLTVCHELGHAICDHYDPYRTLKGITLRWSPANIVLGTFDKAYVESKRVSLYDGQPLQMQDEIALYNKMKDVYRNDMITNAMGPFVGILSSAYMAYKVVRLGDSPLRYEGITSHYIGLNVNALIPYNHVLAYLYNQDIEAIPHRNDGDKFCESWNKRKKIQDLLNELYRQERAKPIIVQNRFNMVQ